MKTRLYFFLWVCLSILLVACEDKEPDVSIGNRTILVYMAADQRGTSSNLSKFVSGDLNEMKEGWAQMNTLGVHLLIYVDDGSSPRLIELEKKGNDVIETVVKKYEDRP